MEAVHKTSAVAHAREAMLILKRRFPQVVTIGSFIYGLPGDTPATIRQIVKLRLELGLDQTFFIPLTPLPGTSHWRPELWDASGRGFRRFSFLSEYRPSEGLTVLERAILRSLVFHWPWTRIQSYIGSLLAGDARKRRISWRLGLRGGYYHVARFLRLLTAQHAETGMVFPAWYEN